MGNSPLKNLPSSAGDEGSIPGQGTKITHASGQLSPGAETREPKCHKERPHIPQCEGGKEQAMLTPFWQEGNSVLFSQWTLGYVPGTHGDNTPMAQQTFWADKHQTPCLDFPTPENVMIPYVINHFCNLYGTHWCRLQHITSWPLRLWIMTVTWLYLSLTFSRLGLRNLGMWAWARTLKVYKVFVRPRIRAFVPRRKNRVTQ